MSRVERRGELLRSDRRGIYCEAGGFYIDPWGEVDVAVITHAHADHARRGAKRYIAHSDCAPILRHRLGNSIDIVPLAYSEEIRLGGVRVTLHPAGHVLGSAQVRVEHAGDVWVASGDYKRQSDPTCADFEPVPCDVFITESTFGLPIFRWPSPQAVANEMNAWWRACQEAGRAAILYGYSLGKAQRLLSMLDADIGPIGVHQSIQHINSCYAEAGIALPQTITLSAESAQELRGNGIVIVPPSAEGAKLLDALGPASDASASGWMRTRAAKRWRSYDRGFVLSDHADWPGLLRTIEETGASRVGVTHGSVGTLVRYLNEIGTEAFPLDTRYEGDESKPTPEAASA